MSLKKVIAGEGLILLGIVIGSFLIAFGGLEGTLHNGTV